MTAHSKLSTREITLLKAARKAAYGERVAHPEPIDPTFIEAMLLDAIAAFFSGRMCAGYDIVDAVEAL